VGELYDAVQRVDEEIARQGLDPVKTRGEIAINAGFLLALVTPDDPDDAARIEKLREACKEVLGEDCGV
jgi:hypothetical protein